MSTVKIKTEPPTAAADIKLEQYTSDIDTKVEPDSEAVSDIKSENDDDDDDENTDQDQFTITPKNQRLFICEHPGCGRGFNKISRLGTHRHEHKLQTDVNIHGKSYFLARQSLNDRWPCPIPDCKTTWKTVNAAANHIRTCHSEMMKQQQQQPPVQTTQRNLYFLDVDDFYANEVRCGYHNKTGVFICYECRLAPECLLTHLQQKHEYSEKSIDSEILPNSAKITGNDPNGNQHTSNSHLASAIREPNRQHHQDIVQGWLCVISNCGYCSYTVDSKSDHKKHIHKGEQIKTVPALILRLLYSKIRASYGLIIRLDTTTNGIKPNNSASQHDIECDVDDDGEELVLSDYSDEDDIH